MEANVPILGMTLAAFEAAARGRGMSPPDEGANPTTTVAGAVNRPSPRCTC